MQQRTSVPIMLPAELPNKLHKVAVDASLSGNKYGILFLSNPSDKVTKHYGHSEDRGTLQGSPKSEEKASEYFDATKVETVGLRDGTEATLRYMEPVREGGNYGPYWEGKFEERGYVYTLSMPLDERSGDTARQVLSSRVLVSQQERTNTSNSSTSSETSLRQAVEDYYEAVDREDWDYTYDNLDSLTRRLFTKEEWEEKNQWFADNEQRKLSSVSVKVGSISNGGLAEATVDRTFDDGSSLSRKTYFFQEDGSWKHRFTQEEKDIFMPGLPYEEFVEAQ